MPGTLRWGAGDEAAIEVKDRAELEAKLRDLSRECVGRPALAMLEREDGWLGHIGLGRDESIVIVQEPLPGPDDEEVSEETHEWISVGDPGRAGHVEFYLLGEDHSDYEARSLVPLEDAIRALGDFLETGEPPAWMRWEENVF